MTEYKAVPQLSAEEQKLMDRAQVDRTFLTDKELKKQVTAIRNTIKNEEIRLRKEYPWLKHQNAISLVFFLGSVVSMIAIAYLYLQRILHWSLAVPLLAIPGSILHELEHDIIHNLYFKSKKWVQHLMFCVIWAVKLSIPPWVRKVLHLRHHIYSGQKEDAEERLIGTGLPFFYMRWLIQMDTFLTVLLLKDVEHDNKDVIKKEKLILVSSPTVIPFSVTLHLFWNYLRLLNGWTFTAYDPALYLPLSMWPYVRDVAILMVLPNMLRQCCLNMIASYCHYYGDIPENSVFYQNQILDHWLLWPIQLFCFNFGATHIIHHYIPNQPFYLRQMLAQKTLEVMVQNGVRKNDLAVIFRDNRYYDKDDSRRGKTLDELTAGDNLSNSSDSDDGDH